MYVTFKLKNRCLAVKDSKQGMKKYIADVKNKRFTWVCQPISAFENVNFAMVAMKVKNWSHCVC